jgi:hypothetical protein
MASIFAARDDMSLGEEEDFCHMDNGGRGDGGSSSFGGNSVSTMETTSHVVRSSSGSVAVYNRPERAEGLIASDEDQDMPAEEEFDREVDLSEIKPATTKKGLSSSPRSAKARVTLAYLERKVRLMLWAAAFSLARTVELTVHTTAANSMRI